MARFRVGDRVSTIPLGYTAGKAVKATIIASNNKPGRDNYIRVRYDGGVGADSGYARWFHELKRLPRKSKNLIASVARFQRRKRAYGKR